MDKDKKKWFEKKHVDVIRPNETVKFQPVLRARSEDAYIILCRYISITKGDVSNNVLLPFQLKYASNSNEVYVASDEMYFNIFHKTVE